MQRLELPDLETANPAQQMTPLGPETSAPAPPRPATPLRRSQGMWIHIAALGLTLFWIGGAGGFIYGLYGASGLLSAPPLLQTQLLVALLLPIAFIWMAALTLARAQELSRTAASLADIALHLSQPEDNAAREVTRLGHAVRRQVDGLEDAIGAVAVKIGALEEEIYQHAENLTRTSDKAEERIDAVRAMLSREREDLESLTTQLGAESSALAETLKGQAAALTDAAGLAAGKIQEADALLNARMEAFESAAGAAHETSLTASRELDHQCAKLEAVADAALTRADVIAGRYDKQRAAIGDATEKLARENAKLEAGFERQRDLLAQVAELAAAEAQRIEEAISLSAQELEGAIAAAAGRASAVGDDFKQHAQSVRISADEAAAALTRAAQSASGAADTASTAIKTRAAQMVTSISEAGVQANNAALHSHAAFEEYADALQESIAQSGDALEEASRSVMSKLDAQLSTLAERITDSSAAVDRAASDAVQTTKTHVEGKFEEIRTQIAATQHWVGEAAGQISQSLEQVSGNVSASVHDMVSETKTTLEEGAAHLKGALEGAASQVQQNAASIRSDMEGQAETMRDHVSHMAQQTGQASADAMEAAQIAIDARFMEIRDHLASSRQGVDDAARHLSTKMDGISEHIGKAAQEAMAKAERSLDERAQSLEATLAKAAQATLEAADHAHSAFDQQTDEIEKRIEKTSAMIDQAAKASREKLGAYVEGIQDEIIAAGELVDGAADNLAATAARIKTAAAQASEHMESALKDLGDHMAAFPDRAQSSADHIREVVERQLKAFSQVAEQTAARAHALDNAFQARLKVQYDALGGLLGGSALEAPGPVAPSLAQTAPVDTDSGSITNSGPGADTGPAADTGPVADSGPVNTGVDGLQGAPSQDNEEDILADQPDAPQRAPEPDQSPAAQPLTAAPSETDAPETKTPQEDGTRETTDQSAEDGLAKRLARRLARFSGREEEESPIAPSRLDLAITAGPDEKANAGSQAPGASPPPPEPTPPEPAAPTAHGASPLQRFKAKSNMRWRDILAAVETNPDHETAETPYIAPGNSSPIDNTARTSLHAIETLQAMTVDLGRTLEADPSVELVKRYIDGDRNLFAKRLVSMKQKDLFERISLKYKNDAEFQSYADSYMKQFEDLLKSSAEEDREDILAETYLSSDTGKLYLLLSQALERVREDHSQ